MGNNHYYMTISRTKAEEICKLTWNQFLRKFGWGQTEWDSIGDFFAFALNKPLLDEDYSQEAVDPILKQTIQETIPNMSPQFFVLLMISVEAGKKSFAERIVVADDLFPECDVLNAAAVQEAIAGNIDDRDMWAVWALNDPMPCSVWGAFPATWKLPARGIKLLARVKRRFGRSKPLFSWQTPAAVRDGHTALAEEDTTRFAQFVKHAWKANVPVWKYKKATKRFRDFRLAEMLHSETGAMEGNCLVHYYGP